MLISRETSSSNLIRALEEGRFRIGEFWYTGPLIVSPDEVITDWPGAQPGNVGLETLAPAVAMKPQIIVLGTGNEQWLPDTALMSALAGQSIGLEIMSTAAACRTYNVLVHEERRVVAALLT